MGEWEKILQAEGLTDWKIRESSDGYCWRGKKTLDVIPGDTSLLLHEIAHALVEPVGGDQHHGIWANCYTALVRRHLAIRIKRLEAALGVIYDDATEIEKLIAVNWQAAQQQEATRRLCRVIEATKYLKQPEWNERMGPRPRRGGGER